ncbi:MAG: dihydroorotate dehydrogenase-like protein [Pirellulales bacterium]|nr:dihydroorotate dehydrogenase-like protein [Pirellulales bacterium]
MNVDLTTRYLGLSLRNPLVIAACPLTAQIDKLLLVEQAGVAAFVMPSLFEEQIEQDTRSIEPVESEAESRYGPALSFFPGIDDFVTTPDAYLRLLEEAKKSLSVPVIASLNGVTPGGWTKFAALVESAGADALELNMYSMETDPGVTAQEIEERYLELVQSVRAVTSVPLAVKLGPYFTAFANFSRRVAVAGADGLVLFNRFFQPDIDVRRFAVTPLLQLSDPSEMRLPLRWIAVLHGRVDVDLAATTGAHSANDVIKYLLAGASVVMVASAVMQHGPEFISKTLNELRSWMAQQEFSSIKSLCGMLDQQSCPDPASFERANYMKTLLQYIAPANRRHDA